VSLISCAAHERPHGIGPFDGYEFHYNIIAACLLVSFSSAVLIDHFTHHVASGYDFGYFVKLLTAISLPTTEDTFFELLRTWFPTVYDIKFMMRASNVLKGGLQDVADDLGVRRPFR
jgi:hypothetical protein